MTTFDKNADKNYGDFEMLDATESITVEDVDDNQIVKQLHITEKDAETN